MYSITIQGETLEDFASRIAAVNAQFATLAASRNAIASADVASTKPAKAAKSPPADEGKAPTSTTATTAPTKTEEANPAPTGSAPDTAEPATAEPTPEKVEYAEVSAAVLSLVKAKGRDVAVGVLAEFGVGNAKELPEDRWAEALDRLNEELAA